jgi:phosphogluconate dehydratase
VRQQFARGEIGRDALMAPRWRAYHGPGTCTFYGTANTNQMLMEFMGLHLPGASFVNPGTPLRDALTEAGVHAGAGDHRAGQRLHAPLATFWTKSAFVNGIVGLMATGGSTNLVIHLPAMARAAGMLLDMEDFAELSAATPLMARVYPNGLADVNHFHAAGGLGYMIGELLDAGLLHEDVRTVAGDGLARYTAGAEADRRRADLAGGVAGQPQRPHPAARGRSVPAHGRAAAADRQSGRGGDQGLGRGRGHRTVEAPARVFDDQEAVKAAFQAGEFTGDTVVVVRFQGPKANGMPELHALTPLLSVLLDRGLKVALVTDGRMSGASGKVPAAIHVCPEAADGGPLARLRDGDRGAAGCARRDVLEVLEEGSPCARRCGRTCRPTVMALDARCSRCSGQAAGRQARARAS